MKNKIVIFNVILLTLSLLVLFIFGISVNKTTPAATEEVAVTSPKIISTKKLPVPGTPIFIIDMSIYPF